MTETELLAAIEAATQNDKNEPNTITAPEYAALAECGVATARKRLQAAYKSGRIEPRMIARVDDWGIKRRVRGWALVR